MNKDMKCIIKNDKILGCVVKKNKNKEYVKLNDAGKKIFKTDKLIITVPSDKYFVFDKERK